MDGGRDGGRLPSCLRSGWVTQNGWVGDRFSNPALGLYDSCGQILWEVSKRAFQRFCRRWASRPSGEQDAWPEGPVEALCGSDRFRRVQSKLSVEATDFGGFLQ